MEKQIQEAGAQAPLPTSEVVSELIANTAVGSTPIGRLGAKAKIDADLCNHFIWHLETADGLAVVAQFRALRDALSDLYDLCESDASFENRDIEPYKFEAIVDCTMQRARDALAKAGAK